MSVTGVPSDQQFGDLSRMHSHSEAPVLTTKTMCEHVGSGVAGH